MTSVGLLVLATAVLCAAPPRSHGAAPRPLSAARSHLSTAPSHLSAGRPSTGGLRRVPERVDVCALAFVLDLLAGALGAGLPVDTAIAAVARGVSSSGDASLSRAVGPLARVGKLIEWGSDPHAAWTSIERDPGYERVAAAGRRCAESGARLAGALVAAGDQLRSDRHAAALAAAHRVGVWSLLPLGLCFLPAFVCVGIVPVIGGLATRLLSGSTL